MYYNNLVLFEKIYEFSLWIYPCVNKFPKSQRFVLGQHIENTVLELLEGVIEANSARSKQYHWKRISLKLDKLRVLIRFAKDMKFINIRQYEFASVQVNEVGKILGGLMKTDKTNHFFFSP